MKHLSKQATSQASSHSTLPYRTKQIIYHPPSYQPLTNTQPYYSITGQIEQVESRIVTENNSSLVSAINVNPNRFSAYQRSLQEQAYKSGDNSYEKRTVVLGGNKNRQGSQEQNHSSEHNDNKVSRPHSNKISVMTENHSIQGLRNNDSSLNSKRPGSVTRGGIKVVSRNSSMQKKSQTSVQKSITSKDLNNQFHINQQKNLALCGMNLNCTTRNPFTQNQQTNEVTVPHLGSLQTLTSHITEQQLLSQRMRVNPSSHKHNHKFYQTISQRTHIQPLPSNHSTMNPKNNHSELMKENFPNNTPHSLDRVYKQVREMMEKQIQVAKKMYEKKFLDQIDSLNLCYRSQIETLQKVLGENLTVIEEQERKICKLEEKVSKKEGKLEKYHERYESLVKFIQKSNKFALQRIDQVQKKFILLLTEFQSTNNLSSTSFGLQNKLFYLQSTFSSLMAQTIIKYRSIEFELKNEVKDMMKKYDYYEQKIYQMDLMKHLGKENQIQNYRLIQSIEGIKEKMVILESRANLRHEMRDVAEEVPAIKGQADDNSDMKNLHKVEQLKRIIQGMAYKLGNLQNEQTEMSIKLYKLQGIKNQLQNKISGLQSHIQTINAELYKVKQERDSLLVQKQKQNHSAQSPQKIYTNRYEFESSEKKTLKNEGMERQGNQQQLTQKNMELSRQLQRLHEVIDQYECKIEQLHGTVQKLERENKSLVETINEQTLNEQKEKSLNMRTQQQQKQKQADSTQKFMRLNQLVEQKQNKLQEISQTLEQTIRQKQQLQSALQMTEKIFDEQISKFKQTIRVLQDENDQLLLQLNQIREGQTNHLADSASSTRSNNMKKVMLAKSPKKEMCETVTMGWFKRNTQQQQANTYYPNREHQQQQSQQPHDEFFYPQPHTHKNSTQQSIDSTSIMQSHPNITFPNNSNTLKSSSPSSNNYYYTHANYPTKNTKKLESPKTETQRTALGHATPLPENCDQFYYQSRQQDEEETYIF